ncbi:hypothetical protein FH972_025677 [Carpinus fangiana]|uniref:Uncharacterized protein n=1 Tax=Carpinus fangiana TaxID=176857 RepID=A0A5N6L2Q2_9ROSI|nr:hypothetical protein FH972_025677 [Carpinus fangiana]
MAPSSAVVSTLRHVTDTKLSKLALLQKTSATEQKTLLEELQKESDLAEHVRLLCEQVKKTTPAPHGWVRNIERFIDQSKHDPSVTPAMLENWRSELLQTLSWQSKRHEYTALFGKLVTEWIENPNETQLQSSESDSDDSETTFEPIGREEMHQQRNQWEEYAFSTKTTDRDAINKYLDGLFLNANKSKRTKKTPLEQMRDSLSSWYKDSSPVINGEGTVKSCIKAVLKSDLFAGAKRQALEDLVHQPSVLAEIADVLNSDLASVEQWQWNPSPVALAMRRQVNGKYRVYMDEEIYQAILLQYIGITFAVSLKLVFSQFFRSGAWTQTPHKSMSRRDVLRREHFLGAETGRKANSVREKRRNDLKDRYFLTQLPSTFSEGNRDYGDSESDSEDTDNAERSETPLQMKQKILNLVTTENLISQQIYGKFTVLQTDFKWFGPAMPHTTLLAVLEYFRVPPKWLNFFTKFITPSVFFAQDGKQAEGKTRTRGIPMAHTLSDALGESLMFCLDFAVNQRTRGGTLYRFHDDLWYWGVSESCETAWKAIVEFRKVMGMELNEEKTGTVTITRGTSKPTPTPAGLPKGQVRWGFLILDSASGRWLMDQAQIEEHIAELKRQLSACRSVFAYVQAFNAYVNRFMLNNFGWPAQCLGRTHIDMCIATIEQIQKELFGPGETIATHLRKTINERFRITGLPDAFFYFPEKLGGLNVANPMISLLLKRKIAPEEPADLVKDAFEDDEDEYETAKQLFEDGRVQSSSAMAQRAVDVDEDFMSLEEFTGFREERSEGLGRKYEELQKHLQGDGITISKEITGMPATREIPTSDPNYWQRMWILELYGHEVLKSCGDLQIGERKLLPLGLLDLMKSEKVRWQG